MSWPITLLIAFLLWTLPFTPLRINAGWLANLLFLLMPVFLWLSSFNFFQRRSYSKAMSVTMSLLVTIVLFVFWIYLMVRVFGIIQTTILR